MRQEVFGRWDCGTQQRVRVPAKSKSTWNCLVVGEEQADGTTELGFKHGRDKVLGLTHAWASLSHIHTPWHG